MDYLMYDDVKSLCWIERLDSALELARVIVLY